MKQDAARWLLLLVALAALGIIALAVANHVYGQDVPKVKSEADWSHNQYMTKLQAAQAENARMRETRIWNVAAILALCGAAASFARNTRAIQAIIADQRRHSSIMGDLRATGDTNRAEIGDLTTEVRAGFAAVHAENKALKTSVEGLADSKGSIDELKRLLREGIRNAKHDAEAA